MNNNILIQIYDAIPNNGTPKSIREIAQDTGFSCPTVGKYVDILLMSGSVKIEEMPPYRLVSKI